MKIKLAICSCLALAAVTPQLSAQSSAGSSAIEKALRDLDAQWAQAYASKDVEKTVSYYSDDAIVLPPNMPSQTSKDAIHNMWKGMIDSGASLSWKATRVEVSKSGDMAYVSGTYEFSGKDPSGTPANDHGKYLEVWEKKADGTWKCGADMWSSDAAPTPQTK